MFSCKLFLPPLRFEALFVNSQAPPLPGLGLDPRVPSLSPSLARLSGRSVLELLHSYAILPLCDQTSTARSP